MIMTMMAMELKERCMVLLIGNRRMPRWRGWHRGSWRSSPISKQTSKATQKPPAGHHRRMAPANGAEDVVSTAQKGSSSGRSPATQPTTMPFPRFPYCLALPSRRSVPVWWSIKTVTASLQRPLIVLIIHVYCPHGSSDYILHANLSL